MNFRQNTDFLKIPVKRREFRRLYIPRAIPGFEEHTPRLNKEFARYLEGKTVAVVGQSSLHNLEQGDYIDQFDVIVRMHRCVPYHPGQQKHTYEMPPFVPEEWHSRIGRRVNIFYQKFRGGSEEHIKEHVDAFREDGGRFFCCEEPTNCNTFKSLIVQRFIKTRYISLEHILNTIAYVGIRPFAGTVVISDIVRHNIKAAYLTGFPCFLDTDEYNHPHDIPGRDACIANFRFIKQLSCYEHIAVDSVMEGLFSRFLEEDADSDSPPNKENSIFTEFSRLG